jgi:glycosyltransferase involved in cell wall biosynthesis
MQELRHRGHYIILQENLAMAHSSPSQWKYLLSRVNYMAQSFKEQHKNYDLIIGFKVENALLAYLLSKKLGVPFVLDSDDLEKISAVDIRGYVTSFLIRRAAKVFVASNELCKLYKKIRSDVIYLPNTTNLEYFNPEKYPDVERSTEPTFFWVSDSIDWFTGCKLIFTSLKKLKRGRVIIIGGGPKTYFKELSKKLGIARQVIVKDWIPDNELPKLYMACDIGLLPFSDNLWIRCKCPSRLFEFMAMELPYICTVGESAYMARKLDCGLIAKPEIDDFAEKMRYAINNLDELKNGAKRGRKYLIEKQNFNTISEKLENELCNAITHR